MTTFTDLRKSRVFGLTIIDLVPTLIIAWLVHAWLWYYPQGDELKNRTWMQYVVSLTVIVVMFLGLGVVFHRLFGIRSALSGYLGLNK